MSQDEVQQMWINRRLQTFPSSVFLLTLYFFTTRHTGLEEEEEEDGAAAVAMVTASSPPFTLSRAFFFYLSRGLCSSPRRFRGRHCELVCMQLPGFISSLSVWLGSKNTKELAAA